MRLQQLRHGWREAVFHPGLFLGAVVTLALGIAGSTTMYSVLSGVGTSMPPVAEPDRVARIFASNSSLDAARSPVTVNAFTAIRSTATSLERVAAFSSETAVLEEDGQATSVEILRISPDYLPVLGFSLAAGRGFRVEECRLGAARVMVVTERFAARRWQVGASAALGRSVRLGGEDHVVVGVLPDRSWLAPPGPDLYAPIALEDEPRAASAPHLFLLARLNLGRTWSGAQAELRAVRTQLPGEDPAAAPGWSFRAISLREDAMKRARFGLLGVLGPALVVLLVACGNVAHLLLARGSRREREMAVRAALGARRSRLALERLAESTWIALAAGLLGLVFSFWGTAGARAWIERFKPGLADSVQLDLSSLAFAVGLTAITPLVFGLLPALRASRPDLNAALHGSTRQRGLGRGRYGGRDLLVIVEIALAVVLVVTGGLFGAFVWEMNHIERRFDASGLLAIGLPPSSSTAAGDAASHRAIVEMVDRVRAIRGVRDAAVATMPVPVGGRPQPVAFDGCVAAANAPQALPILGVGDRYLSTLGLPLLRGRAIDGSDRAGTEAAALLSESAARRCWPNLDAVGRRVRIGPRTREWATIVGVVKDPLASPALGAIMPEGLVIVSAAQRPDLPATLLVRGDGDLGPLVRQLRDAVRRVDPRQALVQVALVDELMSQRFVEGWLVVGLMNVFGALALALAAIGVFGVTSYSVAERTREFGIRIAMGAAPVDILKLVTGRALAMVGIGAALAAAGTAAVTRVMWAELLTLGASSRVGFGAIAGVIGLVALIACLLPARRATRVDPMVALRTE